MHQVIRSETPQYIVQSTYNGEGLRVSKQVTEKRLVVILPETPSEEENGGNQADTSITFITGGTTYFLYDGENVIIEKENARIYNPHTGRFLQADTFAGCLSDPLSLNRYTYCLNNPTRYVDPNGHFGVVATFLIGAAITGLISGAVNAGMEAISEHFFEKRDKLSVKELGLEFTEGFVIGAISGGIGAVGSVGANAAKAAAKFGADAAKSDFVRFCTANVTKKAARSVVKRVVLAGISGAAESAFMDTGHRLLKGEKVTAQSVLWSALQGTAFNQVGEFVPDVMRKVGESKAWKKVKTGAAYAKAITKEYFRMDYSMGFLPNQPSKRFFDELYEINRAGRLTDEIAEAVQDGSGKKIIKTSYGKSSGKSGADNIADAAKLKEYYKQAEKYGTGSIKELENGRFRFYEELKPARTQGEMAGARHVREWDPYTGLKRDWYETLDYNGIIRQVRPDPNITGGVKVHYMFDVEGNYIGNWIPKK